MTEAAPWRVLGHDPVAELEDNVRHVDADVPGMALRRRMTVVRLSDGSLVVHNAVCLRDDEQKKLEAWGPIRWVVVPNGWHRLDAPAYAARYPDAKIVCPAEARARVETVVRVDGTLSDLPRDEALGALRLEGSKVGEAVFVARSRGGARATLVFNDTVFNQPHLPGLFGFVYKLLGQSGSPKVTLLAKLTMVGDKRALKAHLERLAETKGLVRVIPGHGTIVEGEREAREMMREVVASL